MCHLTTQTQTQSKMVFVGALNGGIVDGLCEPA